MGLCRAAIAGVFFMLENNKNTDRVQRHQRATECPPKSQESVDAVEGYRAAEKILKRSEPGDGYRERVGS